MPTNSAEFKFLTREPVTVDAKKKSEGSVDSKLKVTQSNPKTIIDVDCPWHGGSPVDRILMPFSLIRASGSTVTQFHKNQLNLNELVNWQPGGPA